MLIVKKQIDLLNASGIAGYNQIILTISLIFANAKLIIYQFNSGKN